jgi:hypothetical protein
MKSKGAQAHGLCDDGPLVACSEGPSNHFLSSPSFGALTWLTLTPQPATCFSAPCRARTTVTSILPMSKSRLVAWAPIGSCAASANWNRCTVPVPPTSAAIAAGQPDGLDGTAMLRHGRINAAAGLSGGCPGPPHPLPFVRKPSNVVDSLKDPSPDMTSLYPTGTPSTLSLTYDRATKP